MEKEKVDSVALQMSLRPSSKNWSFVDDIIWEAADVTFQDLTTGPQMILWWPPFCFTSRGKVRHLRMNGVYFSYKFPQKKTSPTYRSIYFFLVVFLGPWFSAMCESWKSSREIALFHCTIVWSVIIISLDSCLEHAVYHLDIKFTQSETMSETMYGIDTDYK